MMHRICFVDKIKSVHTCVEYTMLYRKTAARYMEEGMRRVREDEETMKIAEIRIMVGE